jgi:hypothetical protein
LRRLADGDAAIADPRGLRRENLLRRVCGNEQTDEGLGLGVWLVHDDAINQRCRAAITASPSAPD